jgi:hypothetical protein
MPRFYESGIGYAKGMTNEPVFNGHPVVDTRMAPIGKVTDVLYDQTEMQPRWAIVKVGMLGGEHFVPLHDAYVDGEGRVVIPFDKVSVKRAPKVNSDHVLTPDAERELRDYYGIAA